jgi:hypothetical protein
MKCPDANGPPSSIRSGSPLCSRSRKSLDMKAPGTCSRLVSSGVRVHRWVCGAQR